MKFRPIPCNTNGNDFVDEPDFFAATQSDPVNVFGIDLLPMRGITIASNSINGVESDIILCLLADERHGVYLSMSPMGALKTADTLREIAERINAAARTAAVDALNRAGRGAAQ